MAASKDVPSFDDVIQADRKRRKNEALANELLGKNRRVSAPGGGVAGNRKVPVGPSLASRVGVLKRSSSAQPKPNDLRPGRNNPTPRGAPRLPRATSTSQLERTGRIQSGLQSSNLSSQANVTNGIRGSATRHSEISIKGAAGPYAVVASNFAPGTTAADIEQVMGGVGGEMLSCKLVARNPTVIAEMLFTERQGAEDVIAMFNNKKADGRLLYVYMKDGPPHQGPGLEAPPREPATYRSDPQELMDVDDQPRERERYDRERQQGRRVEPQYQDGSYGFQDPQPRRPPRDNRRGQGLYSDNVLRRDQGYYR